MGWIRVLSLFSLLAAHAVYASDLELVVDRQDGSLFLKNTGLLDQVFDGYSFSSAGAFLVGAQTTISGNTDATGDGSVDSVASWFLLGPQDASNLAEASTQLGSALLAPGQIVSFGQVYDLSQPEALTGQVTQGITGGTNPEPILVDLVGEFRDLTADYNGDLLVDELDYDVFVSTFGSTTDIRADGNGDGVVDAADYTVWRDALALTSVGTSASLAVPLLAQAVPEPATGMLAFIAAAGLVPRRARRLGVS